MGLLNGPEDKLKFGEVKVRLNINELLAAASASRAQEGILTQQVYQLLCAILGVVCCI